MSLFVYIDESEVETIEPVFKKVWSDEARANFKELRKKWSTAREAKAEINGHLVKDLIDQYGPTAPYHMKKYGHCDNIGKRCGAKKGNTNARSVLIEGKPISHWSKVYGVSRRRVVKWYEMHGTMKGCVAGKAGGWNKGKKTGARSQESIDKQLATRATRTYTAWNKGLDYWTDEMKEKQSEVAKRVMSCPERRKAQAKLMSELHKNKKLDK